MFSIVDVDVIWMRYALVLADYASISGDMIVGAVLVYEGRLIGYGWNASIMHHDPSAHAEIMALRMGGRVLGNYRLLGVTLYVTLEPCMMCLGAMIHARIYRLVYGAKDNKFGWVTLWLKRILAHPMINHRIRVENRVLEQVCVNQIKNFFRSIRQINKRI